MKRKMSFTSPQDVQLGCSSIFKKAISQMLSFVRYPLANVYAMIAICVDIDARFRGGYCLPRMAVCWFICQLRCPLLVLASNLDAYPSISTATRSKRAFLKYGCLDLNDPPLFQLLLSAKQDLIGMPLSKALFEILQSSEIDIYAKQLSLILHQQNFMFHF